MVPSPVTEAPQFHRSSELIGAGTAVGSPQPLPARLTCQIRNTCVLESAGGRDDAKYMVLPSGESRGGKSRFFPEKGSAFGRLQLRPFQCETHSSPIRGNVVVGFICAK
jgi:hypothetical protein